MRRFCAMLVVGISLRRSQLALLLMVGSSLICPELVRAGELHDAVRRQDVADMKALLASGLEVDESDYLLGTPLHVAVSEGNTEMAKFLIQHGADVEAVSEQNESRTLHLAAQFGDSTMVALLLDSGAKVEAPDQYQRTPLFRAAELGHIDVVRLLLERGANVDAREGRYGETPLHEAAHHGRVDVVKLLLENDADVNAISNTGRTPFWVAAFPQSYNVVGDSSLLRYLIVRGADPNVRDTSGMSVLTYAELQARQGAVIFARIAEELRDLGATE